MVDNGSVGVVRSYCEWSHSKGTGVPRLLWFFWLMMMTYQPIQISKSYPLETLYGVGPGFGEGDGEESRISSNTSPDHAWFSGNRIITEGIGWPVRNVSGSSEGLMMVLPRSRNARGPCVLRKGLTCASQKLQPSIEATFSCEILRYKIIIIIR